MSRKLFVPGMLLVLIGMSCGGSSVTEDKSAPTSTQEQIVDVANPYPLNEFGQPIVPKEIVKNWPIKFCTLSIGMNRNETHAVMGAPTSSFADSSSNQDEWDGYNVSVTAFYDVDDKVRQLDDSTGTSELPCESSRK